MRTCDKQIREHGTPLSAIYFNNDEAISLKTDFVNEIYLYTDGQGIGGAYDRIHIFGKRRQIWNAHMVEGFELLQENKDDHS